MFYIGIVTNAHAKCSAYVAGLGKQLEWGVRTLAIDACCANLRLDIRQGEEVEVKLRWEERG